MSSPVNPIQETQPIDGGTLVRIAGEINLTRSPELRAGLMKITNPPPKRLIVDLAGVTYMDSSGVATLVEAMQIQRRSGNKMVICGLQPQVKAIFEISRLDKIFTIVDTMDEAEKV